MMLKVKNIIKEVIGLLLSLIILIPLYLLFINSLKSYTEASKLNLSFPTTGFKQIIDNYTIVFNESDLLRGYMNSIYITAVSVFFIVILAALAGFVIQRRKQKFIVAVNFIIIAGMTVPGAIVPTMFIMKSLGLSGTYLSMILVYIACLFPMSVFLFTGFYSSIPLELDEAAIIDGCRPYRLFFQVIFPLIKPVVATVVIIMTLSLWNDFTTPLYMLNSPEKYTVVMTVFSFFGQRHSDWNLLFADVIFITTPVIIFYMILQKYIISGLTSGAVKG